MTVVEVGRSDEGTTVRAAPGDEIVLRLSETGGTGYTWQVTELTGPLRVVDNIVEHPDPLWPGAAAVRRLVLAVDDTGPASLRAACLRPWAPAEAVDEFHLYVTALRDSPAT